MDKVFLKMCTRNIGWIDFEKEMAQVINAITNYFDCVSRDEENFYRKGYILMKMFCLEVI